MKIFWKLFTASFFTFIIMFSIFAFFLFNRQINDAQKSVIEQYKSIGQLIAKESQAGYLESRWPFEMLKIISEKQNFLFWWIAQDDGSIYLADRASFMGTFTQTYFPDVKKITTEKVIINSDKNYGLYIIPFEAGKIQWTFWFGFSLSEVQKVKNELLFYNVIFIIPAITLIAFVLLFIIRTFTRPIFQMVKGTKIIASGNLDFQMPAGSNDELGELSRAFNEMTLNLRKSQEDLKEYNTNLEHMVQQRTSELNSKIEELERINKLMVDRELKMIELKKEIDRLQGKESV
jgi:methyl-accepting chemotaxis protein